MCAEKIVTCADLWNVHLQNCAQCRKLHLQKSVRCRFAHFVHDGFSHICRFAHLHICTFAESCEHARKVFALVWVCRNVFENVRRHEFSFFYKFASFVTFWRKSRKTRKSRNFRKCPKMSRKKLTCSWVVHEWFLGQRVWQHRVAKVARICIN